MSDEAFIDWLVLTLGKNSRAPTGWKLKGRGAQLASSFYARTLNLQLSSPTRRLDP